jgi:fatty-acid desaturase
VFLDNREGGLSVWAIWENTAAALIFVGVMILLAAVQLAMAGWTITAYYHRTMAHRANVLTRQWHLIGRVLGFFLTYQRPEDWYPVHRKHHKFTDVWQDEVYHDPHSPLLVERYEASPRFNPKRKKFGKNHVRWHMIGLFHVAARMRDIKNREYHLDEDPQKDFVDVLLYTFPWMGAVLLGIFDVWLMYVVGGWLFGIDGWYQLLFGLAGLPVLVVHLVVLVLFGGLINHDCHQWDERRGIAGFACNLVWLAVLIMGEGAHYDHHLTPYAVRFEYRDFVPPVTRWDKLGLWLARNSDFGYRGLQVCYALRITRPAPKAQALLDARRMGHLPGDDKSTTMKPTAPSLP